MAQIRGLVVFDLDGTLYFGDQVAPGALDLVAFLKNAGLEVVYYTNSSYKHRRDICQKLCKIGFEVQLRDVFTSGFATALYLREQNHKKASVIGSIGLEQELRDCVLSISEIKENTEVLVLGLDLNFDYNKLTEALGAYKNYACKIVACNRDLNYPGQNGNLFPGCGAIVAAVESACETTADFVAGKPNPWLLEKIRMDRGYDAEQILVVGDSINSDVGLAMNSNSGAILVSDSSEKMPGITVCRDLTEVKEVLKEFLKIKE